MSVQHFALYCVEVIRYERYTREDVEQTFKVLWGTPDGRKVATTQEVRDSMEERRLRYQRLHELFPDLVSDPDKQQKQAPEPSPVQPR